MIYTIDNIQEGIDAKIESMKNGQGHVDRYCILCKMWMDNYPKELEQNVLEWVNGSALSEIDFHGVSINDVMNSRNLADGFFPMVIRNFKLYKERGFSDGTYICYIDF